MLTVAEIERIEHSAEFLELHDAHTRPTETHAVDATTYCVANPELPQSTKAAI